MKILFIKYSLLPLYQNIPYNFVIECVGFCSVAKFCSVIAEVLKKQRGNQSGRAGQVVLVCAQPLALTGRNGEADLDQDSRPQPLCAKGTDVAHILMDIMSSYLWTLQSKR